MTHPYLLFMDLLDTYLLLSVDFIIQYIYYFNMHSFYKFQYPYVDIIPFWSICSIQTIS